MSAEENRIGIIGLGLVGAALIDRLNDRGWSIVGFDIDAARCQVAMGQGAVIRKSVPEVLATCDTILLSVPTSHIVTEILHASAGALRPHHTLLDMTTGDPEQITALGHWLAARDVRYIEAKVCGSSAQLRNGEAVLFLATAADDRARGVPHVVAEISSRVFHLHPIGAAARFKLVHNLVLGLHRAVLAEALLFAEASGFEPAETLHMLQQTPAASRVMETKGDKMVRRDYAPQATLAQHLKDVRLILDEAARHGAAVPLSLVHRDLLEAAERAGFGAVDNCAVREGFGLDATAHRRAVNDREINDRETATGGAE